MKFIFYFLTAMAVLTFASAVQHSFKNYKLVRIQAKDADTIKSVSDFELVDSSFDIWKKNDDLSLDVFLSPENYQEYEKLFEKMPVLLEILVNDFQQILDEETLSMKQRTKSDDSIIFKYARFEQITAFLHKTVAKNQDLASIYSAGKTYEGRDLNVIVLKTPSSNRAIWIDCGIHAREWVSPSTCVYIIDQLIKDYRNQDTLAQVLLNTYEIHILPVLNPDGYEYTHETYRLWRKNRSPARFGSCFGTDLNRNYDFKWLQGGSSINPCSDTYAGQQANSELETQAIINVINGKLGQWDAFLSLHSYGNWWLTSWGHSASEYPADYEDIVAKAKIGAAAIKAYNGTVFTVGSSASLLYVNTGSSIDWAKGVAKVKYTYVLELRPGQGSADYYHGFALPESSMPLVATETYLGIKAFLNSI